MFSRRPRVGFLHPDRSLNAILGAATAAASARNRDRADGTSSLDFLVAATEAKPVAKLLRSLDIDPREAVQRANALRVSTDEPGLTPDAKLIIEAAMKRALEHRRDAKSVDLFFALATMAGPARDILRDLGLDEHRLTAMIE
jgi:hypothetical protein